MRCAFSEPNQGADSLGEVLFDGDVGSKHPRRHQLGLADRVSWLGAYV